MVNYLIVLFAVTLIYLSIAERFRIYARADGSAGLVTVWYCFIGTEGSEYGQPCFYCFGNIDFQSHRGALSFDSGSLNKQGFTKVHNLAMPGFYLLISYNFRIADTEHYTGKCHDKSVYQYDLSDHCPIFVFYRHAADCNP